MKKTLFLLGVCMALFLSGQQVKALLDKGEIEKALDLIYNDEALTAEDYYYASTLYYQKGYSDEAMDYIQRAIELEKTAEYYQYLAFLQNKQGDCSKALGALNEAYILEPSSSLLLMKAKVHTYCFKEPNYDQAISAYQEVLKSEANMEAVQSLSLLYSDQNRYKQAHTFLEDLMKSKRFAQYKDYIQFINATLYYEEGLLEKAEEQLHELLIRDSKDYIALAKLIQIRYAQDRAEDTEDYRKRLYQGYKTQQLPEYIKDKFQFDEFSFDTYTVKAFESFEDEKDYKEGDQVLYKHIFEVYNNQEQFLYTIQTEYNSAIPAYKKYNLPYNYYVGKTVYSTKYEHFNYGPKKIDVVTDYATLKQLVTDIIKGKIKSQNNSKTVIEKF